MVIVGGDAISDGDAEHDEFDADGSKSDDDSKGVLDDTVVSEGVEKPSPACLSSIIFSIT